MASTEVLDRFADKLAELGEIGREVGRLEKIIGKHEVRSLARLLKRLKSIMPLVDGEVPIREGWAAPEGAALDDVREVPTYHEPGIVLVNTFASTVRDKPGELQHKGYKVVFTRSGKLVRLDRAGTWSEGSQTAFWSCDTRPLKLDAEFCRDHFAECIRSLVAAVERSAARHSARREELTRRLQLLQAVQRILDEPDRHAPLAETDDDDAPAEEPIAGHGAG